MLKADTTRRINKSWRQYRSAIQVEAERYGLIRSAVRILVSRLFYGVGPLYYSLFRFSQRSPREWAAYVTDDPQFKAYLRNMTPASTLEIANNKARFYEHCVTHGLPTIDTVGLLSAATQINSHGIPQIRDIRQWRDMLTQTPGDLFVKPIDGTFGESAFPLVRQGSRFAFSGRSGTAEDVYEYLRAGLKSERAWIIQRRVRSHSALGDIISPDGLATVRIVTRMRREGSPEVLYCVMKITVGDNVTDNFHHGQAGNLVCAVNLQSGCLAAAWGSERGDWPVIKSYAHHPTTAHPIEGFELPLWREVVELCQKAQATLPFLRSAGWDVAITDSGPIVVEANATYSIDILQVAYGHGLKQDIHDCLGAA